MDAQQQLWIGFGFVAFLLVVLVIIFFTIPNLTEDRRSILRFLISLCAGFAGAFITGQILFNIEGSLGTNAKYGISSSAGFALFLIIWFFFPKSKTPLAPPDSITISIPKGCTFKQAVEILVQNDKAVASYKNFTDKELQAELQARELHEKTVSDAISRLQFIAVKPGAVPEYTVNYSNSVYSLIKI